MIFNKKGQGLSLNAIIVAAIALIVLVVLVMVFTGQINIFQQDIDKKGDSDLVVLKVQYGECHPTSVDERTYKSQMALSQSEQERADITADFKLRISECKALDQINCEPTCAWG